MVMDYYFVTKILLLFQYFNYATSDYCRQYGAAVKLHDNGSTKKCCIPTRCSKGEEMVFCEDEGREAKCAPCPSGHFSDASTNTKHGSKCRPHRKCRYGEKEKSTGTKIQDTVCICDNTKGYFALKDYPSYCVKRTTPPTISRQKTNVKTTTNTPTVKKPTETVEKVQSTLKRRSEPIEPHSKPLTPQIKIENNFREHTTVLAVIVTVVGLIIIIVAILIWTAHYMNKQRPTEMNSGCKQQFLNSSSSSNSSTDENKYNITIQKVQNMAFGRSSAQAPQPDSEEEIDIYRFPV